MPNNPRARAPVPRTGHWEITGETEVLRTVDGKVVAVKVPVYTWVPDPRTNRRLFE